MVPLLAALGACDDGPLPDAITFERTDTGATSPSRWSPLPPPPCERAGEAFWDGESQTVWFACGWLLHSADGGLTWEVAVEDPAVSVVHRSDDGLLYAGGEGVVAVDDAGVSTVLAPGDAVLGGRDVLGFRRAGGVAVGGRGGSSTPLRRWSSGGSATASHSWT